MTSLLLPVIYSYKCLSIPCMIVFCNLHKPQLQNLKKLGATVYLLFHRQASWIQFSSPLSLFCSFILQTWLVGKVIVPLGTGRLTNVKFLVLKLF